MLKVNHLNKYYNRRKQNQIQVLKDVSIDFPKKGLVTILGASGSGKTTLLNVICGLDRTDSGVIEVDNALMEKYRFNQWDHLRNKYFGYIFQNYNLFMDKTVFENVAMSLQILGITDQALIKEQTLYTLSCVGMEKYKNRLTGSLSGGEQQRVAIARALVKDAHIIIADEPTGNLDEKNTIAIMNIIKKISQTRLVVLVTHEHNLANFFSDQIIEIKDGAIVNIKHTTENQELSLSDEKNIYLGALAKETLSENENQKITIYNNNNLDFEIKLVVEGKTLYLEAYSEKLQIKYLDDSAEVKILDAHQPVITKQNLVLNDFNIQPLTYVYKPRRARIRFIDYITMGLKKLVNLGKFKKFMLLGFSAASFLLCFAISSFSKLNTVEEKDFMTEDRYLVEVSDGRDLSVKEKTDFAYSLLTRPEISDVMASGYQSLQMSLEEYFLGQYNIYRKTSYINSSIVGSSYQDLNIIAGRKAENSREIVVDQMVFDLMTTQYNIQYSGTASAAAFLNQNLVLDSIRDTVDEETWDPFFAFKIVGIAANNNMSVYMDDFYARAFRLQTYNYRKLEDVTTDVETLLDDEILVIDQTIPIGTKISENGEKEFIVRGYFEPQKGDQLAKYVINGNTFLKMEVYNALNNNRNNYYLYSNKPLTSIEHLSDEEIRVESVYERNYNDYKQNRLVVVTVASFFTVGVLIASLIYLYYLMRSSLISRINEVGIYRALGMTRFNIYLMFIAEIISLTTLVSLPGYIMASLIIYKINSVTTAYSIFKLNVFIFLVGIILIYLLNFITGLLPVFMLLRKTPREIISKYDI